MAEFRGREPESEAWGVCVGQPQFHGTCIHVYITVQENNGTHKISSAASEQASGLEW